MKRYTLSLLILISLVVAIIPVAVNADVTTLTAANITINPSSYLIDKTIIWGDSTTEHVQIDRNGWVYLSGVRHKLIGVCDPMIYNAGSPYDAGNLAILDTELTYLQSKGVRIYEVGLWIWYPSSVYSSVLQLLYNHKMLVVPLFVARGEGAWDNLTTLNWVIDAHGTVTTYLTAWINAVKVYSNVISIEIENELDNLGAYTYTSVQATNYMALLTSTASALTTIPLITKYTYPNLDAFANSVQSALLPYTAIPCWDIYKNTYAKFGNLLLQIKHWGVNVNNRRGIWITEINYESGGYDATALTIPMIDSIFDNGASVVFLFCVQDKFQPTAMFFNAAGVKIANMDTLMANVATWQVALP